MIKESRVFQKLLVVFLLANVLVCPYTFLGMMFFPQAIGFLEPVLCPHDMQMTNETEVGSDYEGNYLRSHVVCFNEQKKADITWKVMLIMLGFPAFGVLVFFFATPARPLEPEKITLNPNGKG